MKKEGRVKGHQRNQGVEEILRILDGLLSKIETNAISDLPNTEHAIYLIVGCARSGTTLINQSLLSTGSFAYPSNLISRFYYAPYIGSLYHKLLIDLDKKGELFNESAPQPYSSELGKTKGANSPNEFWYFWRRFFKFGDLQQLEQQTIANVNTPLFLSELNAMCHVFDKPLLMKGMIMNWHLDYLVKLGSKIRLIYVKRNEADNAQSLLNARRTFYNSTKEWYSFKPAEYNDLKAMTVEEQVAGQVYYTNRAIESQLCTIPAERYVTIDYDNFCSRPEMLIETINNTFSENFSQVKAPSLNVNKRLQDKEFDAISRACAKFSSK